MDIARALATTAVSLVDLGRSAAVEPAASVRETVARMCEEGRSCACVVEEGEPVGIFTQRDALLRVIGQSCTWDRTITAEMTRPVRTIPETATVADGMAVMNDWWVRSVLVVGTGSKLVGVLAAHEFSLVPCWQSPVGQWASSPSVTSLPSPRRR